MKKLKGFTVLEIILSLTIASLVMAIAISAYLFTNKQFLIYQEKQQALITCKLLNYSMAKDISSCSKLLGTSKSLTCYFLHKDNIMYSFYPDYIVRETKINRDTFNLSVTNIHFDKSAQNDWIQSVSFDPLINGNSFNVYHIKNYGPAVSLFN